MKIEHVFFSYGEQKILEDISLEFAKGKITTILGSNGSGKSTLFKLCTKELMPQRGIISLDGQALPRIQRKKFAQKVSIVHQQNQVVGDITIRELVSYGRAAHLNFMHRLRSVDETAIDKAIDLCGLKSVADKKIGHLSGGQIQRGWLAMAIANQPQILFLDEPTTYLDIKYQYELLQNVQELNKSLGMTIVMVLHDVNQALAVSHEVIGLYKGKLLFQENPENGLDETLLSTLYDVPLCIAKCQNRLLVLKKENHL